MLVSRLACIGNFRHNPKGWSGPLSRHLLAYQSIISSLHGSLRDLLEMILAAMFLEGMVDRDRDDWTDITLGYVGSCISPFVSIAKAEVGCHSTRNIHVGLV